MGAKRKDGATNLNKQNETGSNETKINCRLCDRKIVTDQPRWEIVCYYCQDWACSEGLEQHGKMVKNKEIQNEAWKIVRMRALGHITDADVDRLYRDLFNQ